MQGAVISHFDQLVEYQAAIRLEANLSVVLTQAGHFRARVMRRTLDGLRLMEVRESLSRIGFIEVPSNEVLVGLAGGRRPVPVWGGCALEPRGLIVLGPGQCAHVRTEGACTWKAIWLPVDELSRYRRALTGRAPTLPAFAHVGQAPASASRQLDDLHGAAMGMIRALPEAAASGEAIHGLAQQLMDALVECLSVGSMDAGSPEAARMRDVTTRFERWLEDRAPQLSQSFSIAEICSALGVSDRVLRRSCAYILGLTPSGYGRLQRMHLAHRALRRRGPDTVQVHDAARRTGFLHPGRLAGAHRRLFGQPPTTILRGPRRGT